MRKEKLTNDDLLLTLVVSRVLEVTVTVTVTTGIIVITVLTRYYYQVKALAVKVRPPRLRSARNLRFPRVLLFPNSATD